MKLLLVMVVVCGVWPPPCVLSKPSKDIRDIHTHPYEVSSSDGSKEPSQHLLYSYSVNNNPFETNIHQYEENPANPETVDRHKQYQFPLDRGSVQAFQLAPPQFPTFNSIKEHPLGQLSEQHSDDNKIDLPPSYNNPVNARSKDKVLVCYFGSWSVYRSKPYDFAVTDIDPFSCTHIIYSFAGLDNTTWSIKSLDPELDIEQGAYKAAIGLKDKNPNLKVMIAIGGWAEGGKNYSEMVSKKERRDAFVASVISFMEEHQWDGLDLDWEYPGASDRDGHPSDKANFAALVSELSAEFKPRGWLLTAAVTPARFRVDEGYDVAKLATYLDYIFVMTYDLRGIWYGKADHHSPLSSREIDDGDLKYLNTKDGLNYWNSKGAPMHKLLMGIPFYARTFRLTSKSKTKPGSQAKSGGYLEYYRICQLQKNDSWKMERDSVGGPYLVKGDLWVGYDDTKYIETKMEAVHSMGLGGAFMWSVDLDDFRGVCGTKWPLLSTMRKGLYGSNGLTPATQIPVTHAPVTTAPVTQALVIQAPTRQSAVVTEDTNKKLVCYYGGWSVNRPKPFNLAVADIDPFSCTHIIYSFAGLDNTTWSIKSLDPERDIGQGEYKAAIGLKEKNPNLKVLIAIGGWNEGGKSYSEMVSKKERRDAFVASVISFMEEHQWDGLDLDWEYPGYSDRGGRPSDKANFAALVSELSAEFKIRGWLLTAAVPPKRSAVDEGYDVAKIARDLDYIFVMTYDLRSMSYGKADHHSPLSSRDIDVGDLKYHNTKDGLKYWNSNGAPMHKLLMGIPFYGRTFTLTSKSKNKPGSEATSRGLRDFLPYYDICQEQRNGSWDMARDSIGGPYMVNEDQWVGYDDTQYIATKMEAVHSMGLGGAFMWAIDLDDFLGVCGTKWPLLSTMRKGIYGPDGIAPATSTPVTQGPTTQAPVVTEATICVSQSDCPSNRACIGGTCKDPCVSRCGPNAKCQVYNYQGHCSCLTDYTGNPYLLCSKIDGAKTVSIADKTINATTITSELPDGQTETSPEESQSCVSQSDCPTNRACVGGICLDPCVSRCGPNAKCQVYNYQGYCSCPTDYTGNPYLHCSKIDGERTVSIDDKMKNTTTTTTELPDGLTKTSTEESQIQICLWDPCVSRCGPNAKCQVYNCQGHCSCPTDYTGNPYLHCSTIDGAETVSIADKTINATTTTSELPDGQTETSPEESQSCVSPSDCPPNRTCIGGICMDPCVSRCGPNAKCQVYNYQGHCSCPTDYTGNPYLHCSKIDGENIVSIDDKMKNSTTTTTELPDGLTKTSTEESQSCVSQNDCPSNRACIGGTCKDPCVSRCGPNAKCQVYNYQGYCSCPTDYTGNPYLHCSKIDGAITVSTEENTKNTTTTTTNLPDEQTETSTEESQSCVSQSDCPSNHSCIGGTCKDPCVSRCGPNAKCQIYNYQGYCSCPTDYTGNPYLHCSKIDGAKKVSIDDNMKNTTTTTKGLPDGQIETSTEESQTETPAPSTGSSEVTTKLATPQPIVTTPVAEYICSGSGYVRDESECSVYYLCNPELAAYKFVCPNGLYFDLETSTCDWQHNVNCEKRTFSTDLNIL